MSENRAWYHEELAQSMRAYKGKALKTADIKRIFQTNFPALRSDFVQPSDHCDNWVNKEVCLVCGGKSNAIFSRIERAHYRVR